ncbi:transcription initiation factor TFIID subunit 9-like [Oppia nitens]|uniref:transcription initiation factor TFIID subunit 9-like n=1 Tax=Oppia nitens TaxID=1686743 RepID=UPI0023D981A5|nr:transcription initiation factor TFIID subunit 9-like [Oppia nitens]
MDKGSSNTTKKMTKSEAKANATTATTATTPTATTLTTSLSNKSTPKDAMIVTQILKDMAITDYEPRVIHQMVEFTYRYVSNVLEDAHLFSSYAKKKAIDADDITLAVQLQVDKGFTGPPPRDLLLEIARTKNNQPLPTIKSHNGPRLPADRYSLIACNYKQKSSKSKTQSRPSITGTSLLNSNNNGSAIKSMSLTQRITGNSSGLTIKTSDPQSLKRKLDDS